MVQTKIMLSPTELELVNNADWILTKNAIIQKVYELFGSLSSKLRNIIETHSSVALDSGTRSPKISKGEQYEGLPWAMLDYPRNFEGDDALSIRCFFWWGNYCSITLHVSGKYQAKYAEAIQQWLSTHPVEWYIGVGTDPWKHHFRKDNYLPVAEWQGDMAAMPFCKIARKISLHEWDKLEDFFETNYREIVGILSLKP